MDDIAVARFRKTLSETRAAIKETRLSLEALSNALDAATDAFLGMQSGNAMSDTIERKEAIEILGLSPSKFAQLLARHEIPCIEIPGLGKRVQIKFSRSDLQAYLAHRKRGAA